MHCTRGAGSMRIAIFCGGVRTFMVALTAVNARAACAAPLALHTPVVVNTPVHAPGVQSVGAVFAPALVFVVLLYFVGICLKIQTAVNLTRRFRSREVTGWDFGGKLSHVLTMFYCRAPAGLLSLLNTPHEL